jgi:hypothetical protein
MQCKNSFLIMDTMRNDDRMEERAQTKWENRAPSTRIRWLIILGALILTAVIFGGVFAS